MALEKLEKFGEFFFSYFVAMLGTFQQKTNTQLPAL